MTFAHDGLRDSFTHLAAPPYFYENLRRELGIAERNKSRISLIKFLINGDEGDSIPDSHYEAAILSFAEVLKASIRSEDLCARLGRLEFTLIIKASQELAISLAERVINSWTIQHFDCSYAVLAVHIGESPLEILNRLDNQELRTTTFSEQGETSSTPNSILF
ncbi:MAG: diguanylate cyclase [Actinobacteria bacterium]|nr:diguanylate cyclase [Actinomycetota bacterium]